MKRIKLILITVSLMLFSVCIFAQEQTKNSMNIDANTIQTDVKQTPQATHKFKSGGQPSALTQRVIELAEGDNIAAEKTVRYLKTERNPAIIRIVSDEEYAQFSERERTVVISESELIDIINQFK